MYFPDLVSKVFDGVLQEHGYEYIHMRDVSNGYELLYMKGDDAYVSLRVVIDQRGDLPPYFVVILGYGTVNRPDRDWNAINLWTIVRHFKPNKKADFFSVDDPEIETILELEKELLLQYGKKFLSGDYTEYLEIRKKHNQDRPAKNFLQWNGTEYEIKYDPIDEEMKKKYS